MKRTSQFFGKGFLLAALTALLVFGVAATSAMAASGSANDQYVGAVPGAGGDQTPGNAAAPVAGPGGVITPTSVNKAAKRSADSKGKPGTQNVSTGSGTAAPQNATPGTSPSTPGSSSFTNAGFHGMSGMALLGLALVAAGGAALVLSRRSSNIHINNIDAPQ